MTASDDGQKDVERLAAMMRRKVGDNAKIMRFIEAYLMMAIRAKYRPAAPGDGLGDIYLTDDELADPGRLLDEALKYAVRFDKEEDGLSFCIGCSEFSTNRAFVLSIEAARLLCSGFAGPLALRLLRMAIKEVEGAS